MDVTLDNGDPEYAGLQKAKELVDGFQDVDDKYPTISQLNMEGEDAELYVNETDVPPQRHQFGLDTEIEQQLQQVQVHSMQGIFSDIQRAWMTVDSQLYMWHYSGKDFCCYQELEEVIVGVGLVRPKPGVYDASIEHLLVLATPLMVYLIGVDMRMDESDVGEVHLNPAVLHTTATDNVCFTCIVGTPDGRIFMGGDDAAIYEIQYERDDGWLRRKCRKVNHTRNLLSFLMPTIVTQTWGVRAEPIRQLVLDPTGTTLFARSDNTITAYRVHGGSLSRACAMYDERGRADPYRPGLHGAIITIAPIADNQIVAVTDKGLSDALRTERYQNKLITQHMPPTQFVLLTSAGTFYIEDRRPVDTLAYHFEHGHASGAARFFQPAFPESVLQGLPPFQVSIKQQAFVREASAAALVLACNPPPGVSAGQAVEALRHHGGAPFHLNRPAVFQQHSFVGQPEQEPDLVLSGRHDAVFQLIGRVARTFHWKRPLLGAASAAASIGDPAVLSSSLALMDGLQRVLVAVYDKVEPIAAPIGGKLAPRDEERASIYTASVLITYVQQALRLWAILTQEPDVFTTLAGDLSSQERAMLESISFWDLATTREGNRLARTLIEKMLMRLVRANESDTFSRRTKELHDACPLFHSSRAMLESKAKEQLVRAEQVLATPGMDAAAARKEASRYLTGVVRDYQRIFKDDNTTRGLADICTRLLKLEHWEGITRLVLTCAELERLEPAVTYYRRGEPPEDIEGMRANEERELCYEQLRTMLTELLGRALQTGPAQQQYERDLHAQIAVLNSPFLEDWLQRVEDKYSDDPKALREILSLKFDYFREKRNAKRLAETACQLARLSLESQSRYMQGADAMGTAQHVAQLLRTLRDMKRAAYHQEQVIRALDAAKDAAAIHQQEANAAIVQLNSRLWPLDDLLRRFSEPFRLYECQLAQRLAQGRITPKEHSQIWHNIVQQTWQHASRIPGRDTLEVVEEVMTRLAEIMKPLRDDDTEAPSLIAVWMEQYLAENGTDTMVVVDKLHKIAGYDWSFLFNLYCKLDVEQQQQFMLKANRPLHLVRVLAGILKCWKREATRSERLSLHQALSITLPELIAKAAAEGDNGLKSDLAQLQL
ncbi:hypothetical protein PTSG_11090 [Salpingoeca rosetta]|uniref:Uncharacterized protein n=1 Tax=Salpingoeca rosetta (strain ATCC 50818 / BSB-021) TaxID=946362 RepID=F2US40_SALR5|nr:uncharacterized protein PTSG_11090 [Salpingoeca rosetta]EGD80445.1 hypothetical protein PTSG_11090 [Salpingoeca rosetta]|eukprot:XP_004988009.1 hypothetical protein PTSG_11090 [Salpingoeca rosetta]